MHNIFLIGFMGVGKSTIAKLLAKELQAELVEMDETIEAEAGMSINEIFEQFGEQHFRDLETALVERVAKTGGAVVSCGGGAVLRPENVELMKQSGKIIFLSATPETIYERVKHSTNRPLLNGNMNVEYIRGLMERRREAYENAADVVISTDGKWKSQIVEEILG
ncbi:MAG: shikimate kinase [Agathobacter sp.]|nr:shikimate kinase [Agathobacter sp.]